MLYEFFEKVAALEKHGKIQAKLNVGEPDWNAPRTSVKAAATALKEKRDKYASAAGEPELRQKLAGLHSCSPSNIVVFPGSKFGVFAVLKTLAPGEEVFVFSPHWTAYEGMCKTLGLKVKRVDLKLENKWRIDLEEVAGVLTNNTKLFILNSPNNPTSCALSEVEENKLVNLAGERGIRVLADDAYRDLCFDARKERPLHENVVGLNTFSKTFGMTGWRIGYAVVEEQIAKSLVSFNQLTVTNVPLFVQAGALTALEQKEKISRKARRLCKKRANIAKKMLKDVFDFVPPNAGFYLFPQLPQGVDTLAYVGKLLDRGVAVVPGQAFGPYERHIRVSLCAEESKLINALETMIQAAKA
ncbi:pyridoxal phosphate-dependent aminotransferase [Candidatus Micrarchaeota archaeon]|nr:pyridoxal phosphate-dependent aminotransferase [Candidatus Micrarchaeota archaeon]